MTYKDGREVIVWDSGEIIGIFCRRCAEYKLERYFAASVTTPSGWAWECRKCQNEYEPPEGKTKLQILLLKAVHWLQKQNNDWVIRDRKCKECSYGKIHPVKIGDKLLSCKTCDGTGIKKSTTKLFDGEKLK